MQTYEAIFLPWTPQSNVLGGFVGAFEEQVQGRVRVFT